MILDQQYIYLQELIVEAKKQGYITHSEIHDYMIGEADTLSFDEIVAKLEEANIPVVESAEEAEITKRGGSHPIFNVRNFTDVSQDLYGVSSEVSG